MSSPNNTMSKSDNKPFHLAGQTPESKQTLEQRRMSRFLNESPRDGNIIVPFVVPTPMPMANGGGHQTVDDAERIMADKMKEIMKPFDK
ncbi:hypothetical protein QBC46DRAFT_349024 [Diplogelasinospora grovesii]|uniref:Uncharacterized protein n=1 Tax=Diplogelasinospora grovesii TaxID=303347 RepID=A0AAN6NLV4_9PEZI|nr:hypothetical protein QBC46DRAFT_349024 [Diplogelasinospora grovesii]